MVSKGRKRMNAQVRQAVANAVARAPGGMGQPITVVAAAPSRRGRGARRRRNRNRRRMRRNERNQLELRNLIADENNLGMLAPMRGPSIAPNENYEPIPNGITSHGALDIRSLSVSPYLGATSTGQHWALKALHPNGETVTSAAGIPDHTHTPVITLENRINHVITGTLGADTTDNVDILFFGSPDLAFLWRRWNTAGSADAAPWQVEYYTASQPLGGQVYFPGTTDGGTPESSKGQLISGSASKEFPKARGMYAGITITFDAPALYDQGRVVAAQLALDDGRSYQQVEIKNLSGEARNGMANVYELSKVPLDEDSLFQASPGACVHEAREGIYMPLRFNQPVHTFQGMQNIWGEDTGARESPALITMDGKVFYTSIPKLTTKYMTATNGLFNMLQGVILFRGISSAANLSVKARVGIEAQISSGSVLSSFQHASPCLDRLAIDAVTEIAQQIPMAYPSSYNDFSTILNVIKSVLKGGKTLADAIGGTGLPIISDVAKGASGFLGALGFAPGRSLMRNPMNGFARAQLRAARY